MYRNHIKTSIKKEKNTLQKKYYKALGYYPENIKNIQKSPRYIKKDYIMKNCRTTQKKKQYITHQKNKIYITTQKKTIHMKT